ncbi:MAG TPA: multiprotein bridging factor aMBF1 [Candidatus Binatia bacterium]|nr:multiprotein bridging factor aMBF1 [Candidatus Binatia bacterium]
MQCELCGKEGATLRSNVEGAELTVCQKCAGYGTTLRSAPIAQPQKNVVHAPVVQHRPVSNAGELVKRAREKLGLSQKDFALKLNEHQSMLHKIEAGHAPSLEFARKLEKQLHISLTEEYQEVKFSATKATDQGLTLGDVIKLKDERSA